MTQFDVEVIGQTTSGLAFDAVYEPLSPNRRSARIAAIAMARADGLDDTAPHDADIVDAVARAA